MHLFGNGCQYYDESTFVEEGDQNSMSLLHLNIRSSNKNLSQLKLYLGTLKYKFDIMGLTKTWLTNKICDINELKNSILIINVDKLKNQAAVFHYM